MFAVKHFPLSDRSRPSAAIPIHLLRHRFQVIDVDANSIAATMIQHKPRGHRSVNHFVSDSRRLAVPPALFHVSVASPIDLA